MLRSERATAFSLLEGIHLLREDKAYGRFMLWQFISGGSVLLTYSAIVLMLTEHLSVKGEVVYQEGSQNHTNGTNGATNNSFFCNKSCEGTHLTRRQVLLGAQMTYEF